MSRTVIIAVFVVSLFFVPAASTFAQQTETKPAKSKQQLQQQGDMGSILIKGLKGTEGCLGVKTCRWDDGKSSIVAWFKNKDAAASWYHSDTHQAMIGGKTDGSMEGKEPMEHITNDDLPIMVIATLTPATKPELPGIDIPISQISIELFAALPGGAHVGGRVSPDEFEVPHMRDYTTADTKSIEDKD